jgi:hypothetical protein
MTERRPVNAAPRKNVAAPIAATSKLSSKTTIFMPLSAILVINRFFSGTSAYPLMVNNISNPVIIALCADGEC